MKAYKCDICGKLFVDKSTPTLVNGLIVANFYSPADLCPNCLEALRDTVYKLSPTEENDEPETSSSEC